MIIVFLGPPGAGKGTQADILSERHGFLHFDTGSRLRAEIATGSELGARIASYTNAGKLVPIEIIRDLILKFLRENVGARVMFDGFPRNLAQAEVLAEALAESQQSLTCAVYLAIDEDSLIQRIVNRRFCSQCGEIYNLISKAPSAEGKCDHDGAELYQRKDDTEEVFGTRLKVYLSETVPVLDFYRQQGLLHSVDGDYEIGEVTAAIEAVLGV
jgi:adenylate kinase